MKVTDLRSLSRQLGMRGYSRLKKDDLIDFVKDNLSSRPPPRPAPRPPPRPAPRPPPRPAPRPPPRPAPRPPPRPAPRPPPRPAPRPPPRPAPRPPPRPAPRPPPRPAPRPTQPRQQSVRFRPDTPRQPELLRKLEERNLRPPPLVSPPSIGAPPGPLRLHLSPTS